MKPMWGNTTEQLENAYSQLKAAAPSLPNVTFQNTAIPAEEIAKSLRHLIDSIEATKQEDIDAVLFSVHYPNFHSSMPNFISITSAYINQGGISPYADNLINQIWSFFSSLSYILPTDGSRKPFFPILSKESKAQISELHKLNATLEKSYENINQHQKKISKIKSEIDSYLTDIKNSAEEASNAKTNAEKNVLQSAASKDTFEQLLIDVAAGKVAAEDLQDELLGLRSDAEEVLGLASQGALAKAFENRKNALLEAQKQWVKYFGAGLIGLFTLTLVSVALTEFLHLPPVVKDGAFDSWGVMLRVLLASPILWFTWFSVRQFANNVALIEDYAFKEASALAFVGYKKDMQDDSEMVQLLRESAIHNFASAPSRLISKSEATSPMHDVFEKALKDNETFNKIIEVLKLAKTTK